LSKKPKKPSKKKEKPAKKKEEVIEEEELGTEEESAEPTAPTRLEEEKPVQEEREGLEAKEEPEIESEKPVEIQEKAAKVEAPGEAEPEEPEEEEGLEIVEEKFYDLNLRRIWTAPREKRTPRAVRYIRDFAARRMKSDDVSISEETNQLLWARGISKPPRHLRLRVVKDKDDRVIVFPAETAKATVAADVEAPSAPKSKAASEQ
jgi:large subunit ribosomal protein L31e